MMYLGNQAVGLDIAYTKSILVYENDTFGNDWIEYELSGIDFENNAIILDNTNGIPLNEVTPIWTAALVIKPSLTLSYGMILNEICSANLTTRIKNIGNNKIQFYKSDGTTLINLTENLTANIAAMKLLYRSSNNNSTLNPNTAISGFNPLHLTHVKLTYYGPVSGTFHLAAYDSNDKRLDGSSYGITATGHLGTGVSIKSNNQIIGNNGYDGYGGIIGMRGLDYNFSTYITNTCGVFDLWFYPDSMFGGNRYYAKSLHLGVNNTNINQQFRPYIQETEGFTNRLITHFKISSNSSGYETVGPGTKLQIWDCGPMS